MSPWIITGVGIGVVCILLVFFLGSLPTQRALRTADLPHARLLQPGDGDPRGIPVNIHEHAIAVEGTDVLGLELARALRERVESGQKKAVVLRMHRRADWRALRTVLRASARAGIDVVHVEVRSGEDDWGQAYLHLRLVAGETDAVTVRSAAISDPQELRGKAVRLDLRETADGQDVVSILERFASSDGVVLVTGLQ